MHIEYNDLSYISNELTLRSDVKFIISDSILSSEDYYLFSDLFYIVNDDKIDVSELTEFKYVEIGNISSTEDVTPVTLSTEERNEFNEKYFKKIENGDIIKVCKNDILIAKVRPYLRKALFIDETNESYFYTSAFIHIRAKSHPKILFYALKSVFNHTLNSVSRQGKGYPTLSERDLLMLKFRKRDIDSLFTHHKIITQRIRLIVPQINKLKRSIRSDEEIINSVIINRFNIDTEKLSIIDNTHFFTTPFEKLSSNNYDIRDSVRYNKLQAIQKEILSNIDNYDILDAYLLEVKTRNGWSPENNELEGESKILGIDALHYNGILTTDNTKFTNETRDDVDKFIVNDGDFFISRGNTVNLVALASIAQNIEEDLIFPDIMIKLFVDDSKINKMYLAYIFNSIIGRLYFKYSSRGKQQTMVKVSSDTIKKFVIPKLSLSEQEIIVNEIKEEADKQIILKKQIAELRKEIDEIIECAIS